MPLDRPAAPIGRPVRQSRAPRLHVCIQVFAVTERAISAADVSDAEAMLVPGMGLIDLAGEEDPGQPAGNEFSRKGGYG